MLEHLTKEDVETPMQIGASLGKALERFREFPEIKLQPRFFVPFVSWQKGDEKLQLMDLASVCRYLGHHPNKLSAHKESYN